MTAERIQEIAEENGVIGFSPYKDAIKQTTSDGLIVWYNRDDELRWCSRQSFPKRKWYAHTTTHPERLDGVFDQDIEIVDKRAFNFIVSGPFKHVDQGHDGLAWGIALMFGNDIRDGNFPSARTLKSIPGIGDRIAADISRAFGGYKEAYE